MYTIQDRINRIQGILEQNYQAQLDDPETAGTDLLADVLHYLAAQNSNLTEQFNRAVGHFEAERLEEELPRYLHITID